MPDRYKVTESHLFHTQATRICRDLRLRPAALHRVINGVRWGLRSDPHRFPGFPGTTKLHIVKTRRSGKGIKAIPMLLVLFSLDDPTQEVELLTVETLDVRL